MEYNGGDLSDVGVIQIVNPSINESFLGARWMFHPIGCFGKDDWIACVESDFAFFDKPSAEEAKPNKLHCMKIENRELFGSCAVSIFDQSMHDKFFSLLRGLCVSAACDGARYPLFDLSKNAAAIEKGYPTVFIDKRVFESTYMLLPKKTGGMNFDEIVFGEAVNIAIATLGLKYEDIPWSWYGISRDKFIHDESEYIQLRDAFSDHIAFSKSLFPNARLVHAQGGEMLYQNDGPGRFVR